MKPALVVMAAGMGSRYGGLKQIDPVGPNGEIIIDYSVYDALRAGFGSVVFVIKREIEEAFREKIGKSIEHLVDVQYAFQELDDLPAGFVVPPGRVKPWGTAHAVLTARNHIEGPFAVINGDDFYGRQSFEAIADFLSSPEMTANRFAMVGYPIENTVTEHGYVARGICQLDDEDNLVSIVERLRVAHNEGEIFYHENESQTPISKDALASMNLWGFSERFMQDLEAGLPSFLHNAKNLETAEYLLPSVVHDLLRANEVTVRVLRTSDRWFGVTYKEDKPFVKDAIARLVTEGQYPEQLWG
jgi:choline kinase